MVQKLNLLNFSFPIAVLALTCIGVENTTSCFFPNYSKINVCFTLKFMYLKAKLLVSFHTGGTYDFRVTVKPFFNIVIFGGPYKFSWIIFIVSHCVCNVRIRRFFCSVFFQKSKSLCLCTFQVVYIRITCLIYPKNK